MLFIEEVKIQTASQLLNGFCHHWQREREGAYGITSFFHFLRPREGEGPVKTTQQGVAGKESPTTDSGGLSYPSPNTGQSCPRAMMPAHSIAKRFRPYRPREESVCPASRRGDSLL